MELKMCATIIPKFDAQTPDSIKSQKLKNCQHKFANGSHDNKAYLEL
jgi:hypothetical protein